jgi:hypothetical protein
MKGIHRNARRIGLEEKRLCIAMVTNCPRNSPKRRALISFKAFSDRWKLNLIIRSINDLGPNSIPKAFPVPVAFVILSCANQKRRDNFLYFAVQGLVKKALAHYCDVVLL